MVIFVAGLSGSGKTVAAERSGVLPAVRLDSYFHDAHPKLPRWLGRTDWETVESFNLDAAVEDVFALARGSQVAVPVYDHHSSARVGSEVVTTAGPFVAEGVYAPEVYARAVASGIPSALLLIDVPAHTAYLARVRRDFGERHMNPIWALVRSTRLALRHGRYRQTVVSLGAEAHSRASAPARIAALALHHAPQ